MDNICAGIVTFNPDISRLKENVSSIYKQVQKLLICDNGSSNIVDIENGLADYNIKYIRLSKNLGIAAALNEICKYAIKEGYGWVLTLDQDSVCPEHLISNMQLYVNQNDVAILAPEIVYRNNEDTFEKKKEEYDEVAWVITSASLTNLSVWDKIGGFDEKLFIDMVDYDYCIRARRAGYRIIRLHTVTLMHELGNLHRKKVFGKTVNVTNHSAFRCYYMARNNIILKRKLGVGKPVLENCKLIIKILVFEANKGEKLKAVFKGIRDYKNYFD